MPLFFGSAQYKGWLSSAKNATSTGTFGMSRMEALVCHLPEPAFVLSSSSVVVAANTSFGRLAALSIDKNSANSAYGSSIYHLPIVIIQDGNPTRRDWTSILTAAAVRHQSPRIDLFHRPSSCYQHVSSHSETLHRDESDIFWDEQEDLAAAQETDVFVIRKPAILSPFEQPDTTTSRIRARMAVRAISLDDGFYTIISFRRCINSNIGQNPPVRISNGTQESKFPRCTYDELVNNADAQAYCEVAQQFSGRLVPHCTSVLDADGQVLYLSPSWRDFTGLTAEQSMEASWSSVVHPADVAGLTNAWSEVVKNGSEHWTYEARYRMWNGTYRWFLIRAEPYRDANGHVVRWYTSQMDINDSVLKRQEAEQHRQSILKLTSEADVSLWGITTSHDVYIREGTLSWCPLFDNMRAQDGPSEDMCWIDVGNGSKEQTEMNTVIQDVLSGRLPLATLEHQVGGLWYRTRVVADMDHDLLDSQGNPLVKGF
ncbi:hypothetical protein H2203_001056 [Taxawa tesnikishii (nom. ined.)]|nr:hypothetical protein H2203_001056 [Dothideales sp. JES 119]